MTCIIAVEHDGKVYMGGDSAACGEWVTQIIDHPKVFRVEDFLIGYTDSFRMGQLLEHNLVTPENKYASDLRYLVREFIPAVRECLRAGGYTKVESNQETGGTFLVGYRGKVYQVMSDFQIQRVTDGFQSCGHGFSFALGCMDTIKDEIAADPEKAIKKALRVASHFSAFVREPFTVISM